jgi:hypothetical protein
MLCFTKVYQNIDAAMHNFLAYSINNYLCWPCLSDEHGGIGEYYGRLEINMPSIISYQIVITKYYFHFEQSLKKYYFHFLVYIFAHRYKIKIHYTPIVSLKIGQQLFIFYFIS